MKHILFWLILLGGMWGVILADDSGPKLVFERLSIEQGLSQSIVDAIVQDPTGFMWFATEDGLNKFDGYSFRVFKHDPHDPSSLSHNELKAICVDHQGMIWVGTFHRGLECFDPASERFAHFRCNPADDHTLGGDIVRAICEDHTGAIWVGTTGGGLSRLDRRTGRFERFRHDPTDPFSIAHNDIYAILEDRQGRLWVGTGGGGLNRFDPETGRWIRYAHDSADPTSLSDDDVRTIVEGAGGELWVGTFGGGLNCLLPGRTGFRHYRHDPLLPGSLGHDTVLALHVDSQGRLWVGTDGGGLNLFHPDTETFTRFQHDPYQAATPSGNRIHAIREDRAGVLWLGTYGQGLSKADLRRKAFRHVNTDPNDSNSLGHNIVWSFCEDPDGMLWIGTHDAGLDRYDRRTGRFTHYRHDPQRPESLGNDSVRMVIRDRRGELWLATNGGGLNRTIPGSGRFRHYRHDPADPASLSHDLLRAVFEDRYGTIWVGTYGGGIDRYDRRTDSFVHYRSDPGNPDSISNDYIRTFYDDPATGLLWIGTHGGGLNAFDRRTQGFRRYRNDPDDPWSLSNDFVFAVHRSRKGILWIATYGGGLNRFDSDSGRFVAIRKTDGLPDDAIYGILEDEQGNLWLSTNSGLCRYSPEDGKFRTYTIRDGLQSNEFNGGAFYRSPAGEMFFGGINGYTSFFPQDIVDNSFVPPVVITDFRLFNKEVTIGRPGDETAILHQSITNSRHIELSYADRVVSFEFAALHFASPENNRYAYRVDGLDHDWIDLGTRRFVMFTTLPPGGYTLRVRGSNSDGVWNEKGVLLGIVVRPPWWRSSWAYVGYTLAGCLVLMAVLGFVRQREREKSRLKESELRAEAAELQARLMESEAERIRRENERKTLELENARQLQLAMLPDQVPQHPDYEIAVCMHTATEVGGDYFDFRSGTDGTLVVALGDATGHGTRAGIMVAVMKGLFSALGGTADIPAFFRGCHRIIRLMKLDNMMMAMTVLHLRDGQVRVAAAAMPPLLIYRAAGGSVETLSPCGIFLGAGIELPFDEETFTIYPGDVLLLMTDGLPDLLDERGELFELHRVRHCLAENGHDSPQDIVEHLVTAARAWRGEQAQNDDITLIAIRVK